MAAERAQGGMKQCSRHDGDPKTNGRLAPSSIQCALKHRSRGLPISIPCPYDACIIVRRYPYRLSCPTNSFFLELRMGNLVP